jgi:hypothetical protein
MRLQIDEITNERVLGVLRLQAKDTLVELYFNAYRTDTRPSEAPPEGET